MDDVPADGASELECLREENVRLKQQVALNRIAHDYLVRLAHHFSGEEVVFEGPHEIQTFCERIRRSVAVMVGEFRELLSGRRRFQLEYDLLNAPRSSGSDGGGGTRILRLGDLHGDLGRYLFYWRPSESQEDAFDNQDLKTAIEELKHHQMALLTGFERSVREGTLEVLRHISPEAIESGDDAGGGGGSPLKKLNPLRSGQCWREYKRRFHDLASEDAGWFQTRFLPAFRQGYKEYMWAKKASQGVDHSQADEGVA